MADGIRAVLIRGGRICDGTGAPCREGDVLVAGDTIRAAGSSIEAPADARVIDAAGLVVAPGFIDMHSHADLMFPLPGPRRAERFAGRILQGITTEIVGNCGLGPAPATDASGELLRGVLSWMTPEDGAASWPTLGRYLETLETGGVPLNVGTLVAHGAVRFAVKGAAPGGATAAETARMTALVESALDDGAFGLSTGLIYPPGMFTDTAEILALARPAARAGRLVTSHIRGSSELLLDAVGELIRIGRETGARVHHSHNEAVGRAHWPKIGEVLRREAAARSAGVAISYDMFPYPVAATMMIAIYPPWALEGGPAALIARLQDAETREAIRRDVESVTPAWPPWAPGGWPHNLVSAVGWDGIAVARVESDANRKAEGLTLAALGRMRSTTPFDAVSDLMIEEDGRVGQWVFEISGADGEEAGLDALAADPAGAFCTDAIDTGLGRPHPASWGAFPRVLGRLVRERGVVDLPEAIRKMTSYPADLLGLTDRGRIEPGMRADLVLFDADTVADRATLEDPRRPPAGLPWVLINGTVVVDGGRYEGRTGAGKVLRAG